MASCPAQIRPPQQIAGGQKEEWHSQVHQVFKKGNSKAAFAVHQRIGMDGNHSKSQQEFCKIDAIGLGCARFRHIWVQSFG